MLLPLGAEYEKTYVCSLGLINNYNTNAEFALFARMITALAFVPVQDIDEALDALGDVIPEDLRPLLDWLEDNYVTDAVKDVVVHYLHPKHGTSTIGP